MKAVIMCGGVGSRLRPITETVPKPLVKLLNKCVIDVIIEKLIASGIKDIYLSLGYMATEIIEHCERKNFPVHLNYCTEIKPMGTAGGVKNCINETEEDIVVLSGDNIFDFELNDVFSFHIASDADITLCATEVNDPREYGVVVTDDDESIRGFIEKPTWEQSSGRLVNTGIYVLRGDILNMIPEDTFFDFSENLFPSVFSENKRFMCYRAKGYWGDMGQFDAYRNITREILSGEYKGKEFNFCLSVVEADESVSLVAPCCIGTDFSCENDIIIKNYSAIGNGCYIGEGSVLDGVIVGDNCHIGKNCELKNCIVCDNCIIKDNCHIEENAVIGYGVSVGRFSRILNDVRIWPGRNIEAESVIASDLFYDNTKSMEIDIFGFSGIVNSQITVNDAAKIGQAASSIKYIKKIGFGYDGTSGAEIFKNVCVSGARICGAICYDFGEMIKNQGYFYSSYCSLDMFIYVNTDTDKICFSFIGKNGMPVESKTARSINNNYKFSSFLYGDFNKYPEIYNMTLFSTVYKSFFRKASNNCKRFFFSNIECENAYLKKILNEVLVNDTHDHGQLQLLINNSGSEFFIVENKKLYSSARVLILLCEFELAQGNTLIVPEDIPAVIDEHLSEYSGKIIKVYENSYENIYVDNETFMKSIWCFDPVLMLAKLISVIDESDMSMEELFDCQKDFTIRKNIIEFEDAGKIRGILEKNCSEKNKDEVYYSIESRSGSVRLRQLGNSNKIRMLVEAADMESARELSDFTIKKIKNGNIDNKEQK